MWHVSLLGWDIAAGRGFAFPAQRGNHDSNVSRWRGFKQQSRPTSLIPRTRDTLRDLFMDVSISSLTWYFHKCQLSSSYSETMSEHVWDKCVGVGRVFIRKINDLLWIARRNIHEQRCCSTCRHGTCYRQVWGVVLKLWFRWIVSWRTRFPSPVTSHHIKGHMCQKAAWTDSLLWPSCLITNQMDLSMQTFWLCSTSFSVHPYMLCVRCTVYEFMFGSCSVFARLELSYLLFSPLWLQPCFSDLY